MIIGGIAGIASGVRRLTTDIDAAVRGDAITTKALLRLLGRHGIAPRIQDAASFAEQNLVLLMRHEATGVDLDISLAWSAFEHAALARPVMLRFGRARAPMCRPGDLLVFKAIAGRPKDADDAQALLLLHPDIDLEGVRRRVAELSTIAEAPEILDNLVAWIASARALRSSSEVLPAQTPATRRKRKRPAK